MTKTQWEFHVPQHLHRRLWPGTQLVVIDARGVFHNRAKREDYSGCMRYEVESL